MKKAQPGLPANRGSRLIPWVSWITMGLSAAVGALFLWVDATGAKAPTHALAAVSLLGIAASILTIVGHRWRSWGISSFALGLAAVYVLVPLMPEVASAIAHWYVPVAVAILNVSMWNFAVLWKEEEYPYRGGFGAGLFYRVFAAALTTASIYYLFKDFVWWWR